MNKLRRVCRNLSRVQTATSRSFLRSTAKQNAKGQAIIEIIVSILMFVMMIGFMVSVSVYLYVQHAAVSVAREGTRFAALNINIGQATSQTAGIDEVKEYVQNTAMQIAGATLQPGEITVTPPDLSAPQGQRQVRVDIDFNMRNPLPMEEFMRFMGSEGEGGQSFDHIPIHSTATMRYEE